MIIMGIIGTNKLTLMGERFGEQVGEEGRGGALFHNDFDMGFSTFLNVRTVGRGHGETLILFK